MLEEVWIKTGIVHSCFGNKGTRHVKDTGLIIMMFYTFLHLVILLVRPLHYLSLCCAFPAHSFLAVYSLLAYHTRTYTRR